MRFEGMDFSLGINTLKLSILITKVTEPLIMILCNCSTKNKVMVTEDSSAMDSGPLAFFFQHRHILSLLPV